MSLLTVSKSGESRDSMKIEGLSLVDSLTFLLIVYYSFPLIILMTFMSLVCIFYIHVVPETTFVPLTFVRFFLTYDRILTRES